MFIDMEEPHDGLFYVVPNASSLCIKNHIEPASIGNVSYPSPLLSPAPTTYTMSSQPSPSPRIASHLLHHGLHHPKFTDITLQYGNNERRCHRIVLAQSPVLMAYFERHDGGDVVVLEDVVGRKWSSAVVDMCVSYLYGEEVVEESLDVDLRELKQLAEALDLPSLAKRCEEPYHSMCVMTPSPSMSPISPPSPIISVTVAPTSTILPSLPPEILTHIFSHLPRGSLFSLLLTARTWHSVSLRILYDDIDIQNFASPCVFSPFLLSPRSHFQYTRRLRLYDVLENPFLAAFVTALLPTLPNLQSIHLDTRDLISISDDLIALIATRPTLRLELHIPNAQGKDLERLRRVLSKMGSLHLQIAKLHWTSGSHPKVFWGNGIFHLDFSRCEEVFFETSYSFEMMAQLGDRARKVKSVTLGYDNAYVLGSIEDQVSLVGQFLRNQTQVSYLRIYGPWDLIFSPAMSHLLSQFPSTAMHLETTNTLTDLPTSLPIVASSLSRLLAAGVKAMNVILNAVVRDCDSLLEAEYEIELEGTECVGMFVEDVGREGKEGWLEDVVTRWG